MNITLISFRGIRIAQAVLVLLLPAILVPDAVHAAVEVIPIRHRVSSELLPMVQSLLSPEGTASADDATNQLVVVDSEEVIAQVKQMLVVLDRPLQAVTIRVRFGDDGSQSDRGVAAGGRVSGDDWAVSAGSRRRSRDGLDVRVQDRHVERSGESEAFVRTLSGSWAYIRVGRDIPYSTRWSDLCRRYGRASAYRRIETGFEVKPLIRDKFADLEIIPRISDPGSGGADGVVRFVEAATRLRVPLGQWVVIGGSEHAGDEVVRAVLETGGSRQSSKSSIRLMVEVR